MKVFHWLSPFAFPGKQIKCKCTGGKAGAETKAQAKHAIQASAKAQSKAEAQAKVSAIAHAQAQAPAQAKPKPKQSTQAKAEAQSQSTRKHPSCISSRSPQSQAQARSACYASRLGLPPDWPVRGQLQVKVTQTVAARSCLRRLHLFFFVKKQICVCKQTC